MSLSRNLILGALSSFFSMFLVIVPILVPFWLSLGLTMTEILEIQAIFGISVALFEIPTGYIADIWSRKASIMLGTFIVGCGFSLIPFATTYGTLVTYEIIIALGGSFISGADIAIVYDSLPKDANRLKRIGSLHLWGLIGEGLAAITASFLILWSFTPILSSPLKNFGMVANYILRGESLLRLIFINSIVWGLSSFCVVWLLQPYWAQNKIPMTYFGILWSLSVFLAAGCSKATHLLEKRLGASGVLLTLSTAACIGYIGMAISNSWIGVVAGFFFYINRGLAAVIFTDAFNWRIPSSFRATANSMKSFAFRLSYGILGPGTGLLIDRYGLSSTLAIFGCLTTILLVTLMLPLCKRIHEAHMEYIPIE
jgi:MFS family permease